MVTHYVSDYDGTRNKDGDKVAPTEVDAKVVEDSTVEDKAVRKAATTAKTAKKKN